MSSKRDLQKELRQAGASTAEAAELIELADQLGNLRTSSSTHTQSKSSRWQWRYLAPLSMAAITGLLIGAALVTYSQTAIPGSWLYSTKRASENVAVAIDPSYRATLMMRRSQEVEDLVKQRANQQAVLATLANYRTEAAAYKSDNYAAFEYCKSNLQQAASTAPSSERSAISDTLSSLQV